ncbi:MAG: phage tail tape measure protein [Bacteroidales bacterium]|nr:phage tail tape measure protein [Bacteroidales bacterium]
MSLKIDRVQLDIVINGDQSRIKLRELEDQAAKLKRELKKLPEGTEEYIKKSAELRKVQAEMDGIINKIGILGLTYKELGARQRELNAIMKNLDPRTPQYRELDEQLQRVNARMRELRGGAQETGLSFGKMADGFNRYFGVITAFAASFTGVVLGIRKMVDSFNEFEAKVDELSSITGLVGDDLKWLSDQAKELSTSTVEGGIKITSSATDIVDAYKLMGSARPELLENKEALNEVTKQALILAEAAKMETAPAIQAVAGAMNQFDLDASQSARVINALAAGALEGSAEIEDLTGSMKNVGAVANDSNMSLEQTIAALEVLASKQLKGEEAGTKLRGALLKMKDAGLGYASGQFNMADAMAEANKNIEAQSSNLEKDALKIKYFGAENVTAGTILLNNTELLKKFNGSS